MGDEEGHRPAHTIPASDAADGGTAACRVLLESVRRLRARERGHLAGLLHDGPIQNLATVALELAQVRRVLGEAQSGVSYAVERHVDVIGRELGRLQDGLWPFPRPGSGLVTGLQRRTAWLLSAPLAVAVGEGAAELGEDDIQAVADLVELILAALGGTGACDQMIAGVRAGPDLIFLELNMTVQPGRDPDSAESAAAIAPLRSLAAALHARADLPPDGRLLRVCLEISRCPQP